MHKNIFLSSGSTTVFILTIIFPIFSHAQQETSNTIVMDELVITGSKQYKSAGNVTQKIDVIDSAALATTVIGNNNLAELIAQQPGASVSALSRNDANWGTYAGIGPKYSTYMLNGLPLDAFVDPLALDLMAIERIEIQRGPASVLYPNYLSQDFAGNQSPLAGTVNLILKENINHRASRLLTSYGSFNTLNTQFYHQDTKDNLNYFGGINFENSDYTNYGTENSWLNMQKDPEYQRLILFAGANYFYGGEDKNKLSVFINKTNHKGDAGRIYRGFEHNYTTVNIAQTTFLTHALTFNASAGLRIYDRTWQESTFVVVDSLLSNNGVTQNILPVDANLTWSQGGGHTLVIGVDYQNARYHTHNDPLQGYRQFGNKSRALQTGVYAQEELQFGGLTVRGGMRYNFIQTTIDLISGGNPGEPVTKYNNLLWNAGVKYHLSPAVSLFANAGNSFLPPGLKSMGGTITLGDEGVPGRNGQLPNPDLRHESGIGLDAGTDIGLPANLQLSLRGFYMHVEDAIVDVVVSENPSQSQSINAGSTRSSGFEIELAQTVTNRFSWFANYTYMNTFIRNDLDSDQNGASVPFAPTSVANAGFTLSTRFGLKINPVLNYNSGYYDSTFKSGRSEFTPGAVIHLFASQALVQKQHLGVQALLRVYNLTDNRYEMPWQFQNTGLAITGGFVVQLR
jgi:outer membrane receptor protein involved in Fe transport